MENQQNNHLLFFLVFYSKCFAKASQTFKNVFKGCSVLSRSMSYWKNGINLFTIHSILDFLSGFRMCRFSMFAIHVKQWQTFAYLTIFCYCIRVSKSRLKIGLAQTLHRNHFGRLLVAYDDTFQCLMLIVVFDFDQVIQSLFGNILPLIFCQFAMKSLIMVGPSEITALFTCTFGFHLYLL